MPKTSNASTSTSAAVHNEQKSPDFAIHPATAAARYANLALALERDLQDSAQSFAAMAA
jgi:hypothetical protein